MTWRLRVYPAAVVAVLGAVVVLSVVEGTGTAGSDEHLGGDYPAFYAAGTIARDGAWDRLYDEEHQQALQVGLVDDSGGFLYFAYPPAVAAGYGLLAALEYRWSYLVHTLMMGAALWGAVLLARPLIGRAGECPLATFAVALISFPVFRAVTGGQNTALTLLLTVGAARFDRDRRPIAAGAVAGLLLYKPQFGVVLLVLFIIRRRWLSAASAAVVGAALWVVGAALMGAGWVSEWWSQAVAFSKIDAEVNSKNLVSLVGAFGHVLGGVGEVIGWGLSGLLVIVLFVFWRRTGDRDASMLFALGTAAAVLVLPRPLFYEAGLALFVAALVGARQHRLSWVAGGAVLTWGRPVSGDLGSLLLMLLVVGAVAWALITEWPSIRREELSGVGSGA